MADDIVTRLRQAYEDTNEVASVFLAKEAADEIERLRTERDRLRQIIFDCVDEDAWAWIEAKRMNR